MKAETGEGGEASLARKVAGLADQAIPWVAERLPQRITPQRSPIDTAGRLHRQQDIAYHIEFLAHALDTASPECFVDYVRWVAASLPDRSHVAPKVAETLRQLQEFYRRRLSRDEMAGVTPFLKRAIKALETDGDRHLQPCVVAIPDPVPQVDALIERLLAADIVGARMVARQVTRDINGYLTVATRLVQPAMYKIGELWERNQISVAEEHLASAIAHSLLTHLIVDAPAGAQAGRTAVFACVEGNNHDLGLRIVADGFALHGWSVHHLGANTPPDALLQYLQKHRPDLLGLSASIVQQLPAMRRTILLVRREMAAECPKILVGGLATNQMHAVWRWLGADLWGPDAATALDAVATTLDHTLATAS